MAPKQQAPLPMPVPVGLQRKRGAEAPPDEVEDPVETPGPAAAKNKWWKTRQGRKGLARAAAHRNQYQWKNLEGLIEHPYGGFDGVPRWNSPLERFRHDDQKTLARLTLFCLQVVIRLVSHWVVSEPLESEYGAGRSTAPRLALLILAEEHVNDASWLRLTNMRRALFKRAMVEGEDTKALKEALHQEGVTEQIFEATTAVRELFTTKVAPAVREGKFPRLDFTSAVAPDKQYDNCWKDSSTAFGNTNPTH